MLATFYKEQIRLYMAMKRDPGNPFHADLGTRINLDEEIAAATSNLAEMQGRGQKPLRQADRFSAGGIQDLYASFYWQVCLKGHNNIATLEARHIVGEGDDMRIILKKPTPTGEFVLYLDGLLAVVLDASLRLHEFLTTGAASIYNALVGELHALRQRVHEETTDTS
jgi:hypothetical protein